jgi:ABC-type sugar transport system permease subunit
MEGVRSKKRRSSRLVDKKDVLFYVALMAFPMLQFCVFYIGVNANSLFLAFKSYDIYEGTYSWVGFQNFAHIGEELTQSYTLLYALKNSLIVWVCNLVFGTFFATLFSYYIYQKRFLGVVFKFILFLPSILPVILLTTMFKFFANEAIPELAYEWTNTKIKGLLVNPDIRFWAVLFYNVWVGFGAQVLLYSGAMNQISPSVMEAADLDGASSARKFFSIVLPSILPTVGTFLLSSVAGLFMNQANLWDFYGNAVPTTENYTIGYYLYWLVNRNPSDISSYPYAAALGIACTFIALPLTYAVRKWIERWE